MKRREAKRTRLLVEELEPRILYSADAGALANPGALVPAAESRTIDMRAIAPAAANSPGADAATTQVALPSVAEIAAPAAAGGAAPAGDDAAQSALTKAVSDAIAATRHEIAFVDTQLAGYEQLVDDLNRQNSEQRQIQVVLLDASRDGIQQIGDILQNRQAIDALHIYSHGMDGAVELGGAWLNAYSLEARADAIGQWGTALSAHADIKLYGCDVAADGQGQRFVNRLGELTGADVAASRDATGNSALGGNWDLEYSTGSIETAAAIDTATQQQWAGLFAIIADTTVSSQVTGSNTLTMSKTINGGANGLLIVDVAWSSTAGSISSVTYGGTALTLLGTQQATGGGQVQTSMYYMKTPPVGIANIVITMSASMNFTAGATSYIGVDQATPFGTFVSATGKNSGGAAAPPSVTVSSAAGELVIDTVAMHQGVSGTAGGSQAAEFFQSTGSGGADVSGSSGNIAGAASVTTSWSISVGGGAAEWAIGAVALKPSAGNTAPTFTVGDGIVTTAVGSSDEEAWSVVTQSDGKILASGPSWNGSNWDFSVVRYNSNGSLDTTFGTGGKVTTTFGSSDDRGGEIALQPDGKILVVGYTWNGLNYDFALARYNSNGSLDATFGTGGKVTAGFGIGDDLAYSVVLQTDGKIVLAGYSTGLVNADFSLIRYNANGTLDTSFGTLGKVTTAVGSGNDYANAVALQSDGKIVVAGRSANGSTDDIAVVRYNTNGALDATFGTGGKVTTSVGAGDDNGYAVKLQSDGKIVVSGWSYNGSNNDIALVRYNANGSLDATFGTGGKVTTAVGAGDDLGNILALQSDGKIVVAGVSNNGSNDDLAIIRYNANGSLDTTFDVDGKLTTPIGPASDGAYSLSIQPDGKILAGGWASNGANYDFALVRYAADGHLDRSFDTAVNTLNGTPSFTENGAAVILDSNVQVFDAQLDSTNDYGGTILTLARSGGANAEDLFSATGSLAALTAGGNLVLSGSTVGTVTTNSGGTLVLTFNGGATQAVVSQTLQSLAYANSSNAPPASVQINWTFSDGNSGSQGSGGALQATGSTTVAITAVNDAPTLDASKSPTLATVSEDLGAPVGAVGTLVSSLVDFASPAGQIDNVTDADAGALTGVAITAADTTSGTWFYSTNNGTNWSALGAVANNNARLLAADGSTRVYFQPNANYAGTLASAITFRAWDQSAGANGSFASTTANGGITAFSSATDTASLTVNAVNDAPLLSGANNLTTIPENPATNAGTLVSTLIAGRVTDADAGASSGIAVTAVDNTNGTWQYSTNGGGVWTAFGAPSGAAARLLAADANTYVRFVPNANWAGTVTNGITFSAWDQTSGANGGTAVVSTLSVSDSFSANSYSNNNGTANWTAAWVETDSNGGGVSGGRIDVSGGQLEIRAKTVGDSIYREANLSGATSATFSFGYDNSLGGSDSILVQISNNGGGSYTNLVVANSSNAGPGTISIDISAYISSNTRVRFYIAGGGNNGYLYVDNVKIDYAGATAGGATAFSTASYAASQVVAAVNHAPAGTTNTVSTLEDTTYTFTAADWGFTDANDIPANAFAGVRITSTSGPGFLTLSGVVVGAGQFISVADLNAGNLKFTPVPNTSGAAYAWGTFQVQDDGGTAFGGTDVDPTPRTMTVNVIAVNDAPVISTPAATVAEAVVNTTAAGNQTEPATAMDASGNYVVVWTSDGNQDGNGKGIFAQRFSNAGVRLGGEFQVNTYFASDQSNAAVAMAADGSFVVVWSSNGQDGNSTGVYGQRFDVAGNKAGGEFRISETTAGRQDSPAIAIEVDGSFAVVWRGDGGTSRGDIYAKAYDAAGNAITGEIPMTTASADDHDQPVVGINAAGSITMAWKTIDIATGKGKAISAIHLISAGVTIPEFKVNTFSGVDLDNPTIAVAPDGRFVIAWSSNGQDGSSRGIYAQRYNAVGAPVGGEFRVNTTTANSQEVASAAMDGAGNFVITWVSNLQDGSGKGIYAQRYDAAGVAFGSEYLVNTTTLNAQDLPAVAMSPAGNIVVVWQGNGTTDPSGVFMQLDRSVAWTVEDSTLVFSAANGKLLSVADIDAGGGTVQATLSAASGAVTLAGTAGLTFSAGDGTADATMTFTGTIAAVNAALDGLVYTPAPNFNGRTTLTLSVNDQGNSGAGGALVGSAVVPISVASVNDAPSGTNKTVTTLEDTAYTFTAADFGLADPIDAAGTAGANALLNIKVTTVPVAGSLTLSGVAVVAGQFVSVANINAGTLKFTPAANANGAGYASFTFQVQDDGGTATGGVDLDPAARTMSVNVTAVNDAPIGASKTVTTLEDTLYTFTAADFGFTDAVDSPVNALLNVKITSVPGAGSLKLSGVAVTAGQFVTVANINAGNLKFTPAANANGAGYASFTFQVQDDGGTANGGVNLDSSARTMSVNVTPVNDAPAGANNTVTMLEDTVYAFSAADFGFTDPTDGASTAGANVLLNVKITTLPGAGVLALSGVAVTAGQFVSVTNINAGNLKFTSAANANGSGYASFTFRVQDGGGTASGGVDLDTSARTMTVNVTAVNDAPIGTNKTVTTLEDTAYTFSVADFGFTDPNSFGPNNLLNVKISTLPGAGSLKLSGVAVTAGQFVSVANITAGNLKFTPAANGNGASYASFTFRVQDDGGTANGGVDLDTTARTMTVNVTAVNDAPVGTNKTVTTLEDTAYTFTAADFGFTDPSDAAGAGGANALTAVKIIALPGAGTLALSGVAVTANQVVSVANINAGNLKFTAAANANGAGYASFTFKVQDDGGTANGGVDLDASARTMTVNVTAVNDAPAGTNKTVTTLEDTAYTFSSADFGFADSSDSPANTLLNVKITTLPGAGSLQLSGVAVTAGQFVSAANIGAGNLKYTPVANANGTGYAAFTFQVQDSGGTANGGIDLDATPGTLTVNVTAVNDAPVGTSRTVTAFEDIAYVFTVADFGFNDPSDSPANNLLSVKITALPAAGSLTLSGAAVSAGQSVSAANLAAGQLKFTAAANVSGAGYASFTFQVRDTGGTASGGADIDSTPRTMTVDVTAVNDAPVNTVPGAQTAATNAPLVFSTAGGNRVWIADIDAGSNPLQVTLTAANGTLTLSGTAGLAFGAGTGTNNASMTFSGTIADINAALDGLRFDPALNYAGSTTLDVFTSDLGNTGSGGAQTDTRTIVINVSFSNTAPVLSGANNLSSVLEDAGSDPGTLVSSLIAGKTSDGNAGSLTGIAVTAVVNTNGKWQYSIDGGSSWSDFGTPAAGSARLLAADAGTYVRFQALANWHGSVANGIAFRAWDQTSGTSGGTANTIVNGGMTAFSTATASAGVNVLSVNDAPAGTSNTVTALEDSAYVFTIADFGFTDSNDSPANTLIAIRITTLPAAGSLSNNGVSVAAGQFVSAADINAGKLVFTPAANDNAPGYAAFTFQVQDDGGTSNGGADLDAAPRTMMLNVTAVNDAPVATGSAALGATLEDTLAPAGRRVGALFGGNFSDSADSGNPSQNQLAGVAVRGQSVSAAQGRWQYSTDGGATWANFGAISDTNAMSLGVNDRLRFLPAANFNGTPTNLSVRLIDNSTGVTGGATVNASTNGGATPFSGAVVTTAAAITAVNDAPVGTSAAVTILENAGYTFTAADFGFTDPLDDPGNAFAAVKITTVATNGTLIHNGASVTAGELVSVADINAGNLVFTPVTNASGSAYASFTFQVEDDGGTALGGIDLDDTPRTMTLNVTEVNEAPVGTSNTVTAREDTDYVFTAVDFGFSDAIDSPVNQFAAVKITGLPVTGTLQDNGVNVTAGQFVSIADINAGKLVFAAAANMNGAAYASFTFQVQDDGGTANGGFDLDATPRTMTVDVTPVNDAPAGAGNTVTTLEDTAYTFSVSDFSLADAGDSPANALLAVRITTLPATGILQANGLVVNVGQFVSLADIGAGSLVFIAAPNANGPACASFTFQVQDDGGVANGGSDVDPAPRTMTVNVIAVNDAPAGSDRTVTILQSTAYVFSVADFGFTDLNDAVANIFASVSITTVPGTGLLSDNGVTVTAGQTFSVAEIVAGRLVFTPVAGATGNNHASFTFQVQDSGGIANAGADLDPTPRTLSVNVIAPTVVPVAPDPVLPPVTVTPPAPAPAPNAPPSTAAAAPAAPAQPPATAAVTVAVPAHAAPAPVDAALPVRTAAIDSTPSHSPRADAPAAGGQPGAGSAQAGGIGLKGPGLANLPWFNVGTGDAPSFMNGVAANTPADFKLAQIVSSAVQQSGFEHALDKARESAQEETQREERIVSSAIMGSTGLSVGYLVWLLRSGALISSLLSSLPAWRTLDPFPVLSNMGEEEEDEDDDSLEALVAQDGDKPAMRKSGGDA